MKPLILKVDLFLQSLLVALNLILLLYIFTITWAQFFTCILLLQLPGGLYQILSSGILLSITESGSPFLKWRFAHCWGSVFYIALLCTLAYLDLQNKYIWGAILIAIPQIIFYAYYILTIIEIRHQNKQKDAISE